MIMKNIRVGLDIGSTTLKAIAIDDSAKPLFTYYERHNADVLGRMEHCFGQLRQKLGEEVQTTDVPIDAPVFSFKDEKTLYRQCRRYLLGLGVDENCIRSAFAEAIKAQEDYEHEVVEMNRRIYAEALELGRPVILLAGRPYHTDPLIQHQLSDVAASLGAYVITEDIARELNLLSLDFDSNVSEVNVVNRLLLFVEDLE